MGQYESNRYIENSEKSRQNGSNSKDHSFNSSKNNQQTGYASLTIDKLRRLKIPLVNKRSIHNFDK
jgi:hypothetical protein